MRLIVGCPVYNRDWVLGEWYSHLEEWRGHGIDLFYCFVIGSEGAYASVPQVILQIPEERRCFRVTKPRPDGSLPAVDVGGPTGARDWTNHDRVRQMVRYRNILKQMVVSISAQDFIGAEAFLSIDSDVLAAPYEHSRQLFNDLRGKDAVAPLVWLGATETNAFVRKDPSRAADRIRKLDYMQSADVICAAKLMTMAMVWDPRVEYMFDPRGEDFGWSQNARACRYELAFDPLVKWKHVMNGEQLTKVDRRLGW